MSTSTRKNNAIKILIMAAVVVVGTVVVTQTMAAQDIDSIQFNLRPNPKFVSCLGVAGWPTPAAHVTVQRGKLADTLTITGQYIKPGLAFDMFTVERSSLLSDGTADPNFTNFGLAWYQSDLQANSQGKFTATIKTILLDQIFGFDQDLNNPNPINAFQLGFWFNNPNDANVDGCVFDVSKPTPFNGEHNAGPVAMISVPNARTGLGPLCTNPNTGTTPPSCNP
jgi:hypothetical protein